MFRGKVTNVTSAGVFVQTADFGTVGPCQAVNASYTAGDMVLCVNVGDDTSPDLVVIGTVSATGSAGGGIADPGTVTDNAIVRWDGTSGSAVQNSGVTISDTNGLSVPGGYIVLGPPASSPGIGVSAPASAYYSEVNFSTAGSSRWRIRKNATAESGSNNGSDLEIQRRNDSGSTLSTITISRATGKITFPDVGSTAGIELGSSGPTITTGTGAPSHSAPNGSVYLRTDGTSTTTLYIRAAGAWVAK